MLRSILLILSITLLTGCSELKVIGSAAMRELSADGMNVERISYNYHAKLEAREKAGVVMMAKADISGVTMDGRIINGDNKPRIAKAKRIKGLWEQKSL